MKNGFGQWVGVGKTRGFSQLIRNGYSGKQQTNQDGLAVTRIETISNEIINVDKVGFVEPFSKSSKFRLIYGDILFSHINSLDHLGKTAIYTDESLELYHGVNLLLIRTKNQLLDPFFLNYFFKYYRKRNEFLSMANKSVNQASINQMNLEKMAVPIPPLKTQKMIVAILGKAEEIKRLRAEANAQTQS